MKIRRVDAWMSKPAIVVAPAASLVEAQQLMQQHRIRRLPVVEAGQLIGIITRSDLRAAQPRNSARLDFYEWRALLLQKTVRQCMTANPLTTVPGESMMNVAHTLLANAISGLPVVEDGQVLGVVSESDLLHLLIADEMRLEELAAGNRLG